MVSEADPPLQMVVEPLIDAVGRSLTVTVAEPVRSPAFEVQFASLNVATVYVVVEEGETLTEIEGAVPENGVPSDKVPLIVPLPVTEIVSEAEPPLQMVVEPLIDAVGRALTVTVAEPVRSPAFDVQFASLSVATV